MSDEPRAERGEDRAEDEDRVRRLREPVLDRFAAVVLDPEALRVVQATEPEHREHDPEHRPDPASLALRHRPSPSSRTPFVRRRSLPVPSVFRNATRSARSLAQLLPLALLEVQRRVAVEAELVLLRRGGSLGRVAESHADLAPTQLEVGQLVFRSAVAEGTPVAGLDLALGAHVAREAVGPVVELAQHLRLRDEVLGLVVAVLLAVSELDVMPQEVGHLDPAVAALLDER